MKRVSLLGAVLVGLMALGGLSAASGWCGWTTGYGWTRPTGYVRPATTAYWGSYWCCPVMNHPAGYHAAFRSSPFARHDVGFRGQQSRRGPAQTTRQFRRARTAEHHEVKYQRTPTCGGCCCR